jgi:serine/threonine-protein kinase RsbW
MTAEGEKLKLRVEADLQNLSVISNVISEAMKQAGIDVEVIGRVLMAVDEACTNIILYAYPNRKGHIALTYWLDQDDFTISIEDDGQRFNPCSVPSPDLDANLDNRTVGGLGVHFIRKFMDEIGYQYVPGVGNQLTMRKHVKPHGRTSF